ncbi:MAG: hypothetical protein IKD61_08330 [Oscillospiraceae bacterium]|nr:hypothetical protein [Oscillospiraceae bacterium]
MSEATLKKLLYTALLLLLALFSFLFLADRAAAPATHAATVGVIDQKTEDVLTLTASASLASFGVSAIPGDTATPIASKLADFSEYFLLILCVLYSEKYLLGVIGAGVFKVLVPCACGLGILSIWRAGPLLRRLAFKLTAVGLALYLLIPVSFKVSDMIYSAYSETIDTTISAAETLSEETAPLADAAGDEGLISSILDRISETATSLTDKAVDTVNRFVETLAVMIVTSCVIPLLVLLFFLWVIKQLTGIDLGASLPLPRRRRVPDGEKKHEKTEAL